MELARGRADVDVDADWVGVELGDLGELLDLLEQVSS
jgi:hypothetical protein